MFSRVSASWRRRESSPSAVPKPQRAAGAASGGTSLQLGNGCLLAEDLRREIVEVQAQIDLDVGGGATLLKTLMLADLIVDRPVLRAVEIGVYRGRLLLPLALVMKWRKSGEIIGIDPYSATAAEQYDDHEVPIDLRHWPNSVDWGGLYHQVLGSITSLGVDSCCRIVRARSEDVAADFPRASIDLLHIDGNHDRIAVSRDARLYIPRVAEGGYVVLDDVTWSSIRPVFDHLSARHELVFQIFDGRGVAADSIGGNDFAVFRLRYACSPDEFVP